MNFPLILRDFYYSCYQKCQLKWTAIDENQWLNNLDLLFLERYPSTVLNRCWWFRHYLDLTYFDPLWCTDPSTMIPVTWKHTSLIHSQKVVQYDVSDFGPDFNFESNLHRFESLESGPKLQFDLWSINSSPKCSFDPLSKGSNVYQFSSPVQIIKSRLISCRLNLSQ